MDLIDHILQGVDKYGFASAVAAVLLAFVYKATTWFGQNFVVPVREAIKQYLADMTAWNRSIGEQVNQFREEYAAHHAWEEQRIADTDQKLERILDKLTRRLPRPNTDHGE